MKRSIATREISAENLKKCPKMSQEQIDEWEKTRQVLLKSGYDLSKCILTCVPDLRQLYGKNGQGI